MSHLKINITFTLKNMPKEYRGLVKQSFVIAEKERVALSTILGILTNETAHHFSILENMNAGVINKELEKFRKEILPNLKYEDK